MSAATEPCCDYCGLLGWTVEKYGRVTHKQACPHRIDAWHQGDPAPSAASGLRLVPISLAVANEHVAAWHRHNDPVVQCIYRVGVSDGEGVLRAVAIVENPKARGNADGETVEITRVASDGTTNACSMLYGACARAAFALGYRRVITYLQGDESGTSTSASGFRLVASRPARRGWDTPSRPRDNDGYRPVPRQLWEKVA